MLFGAVEGGEIVALNITQGTSYKNVVFGINSTFDDYINAGLLPIEGNEPIYNPIIQDINGPEYSIGENVIRKSYTVIDKPINEVKEKLKSDCVALATRKRNQIVTGVSAGEMASWPIKREQAYAYLAQGVAATDQDAPALAEEAAARGTTTLEIVNRVAANAENLLTLESQIAGVSGRHRDAIDLMLTLSELAEYDITTGWPV